MRILIAIHGSHAEPERMQAQRDTWIPRMRSAVFPGRWRDGCVHVRLFFGQPAGTDPLVTYGNFADGPVWQRTGAINRRTEVLNRKTQALCRFGLDQGYDYVFKCDDDTYVRPQLLIDSGFENHLYSGHCESHNADDVGDYLWAGGGGGYWLSRRAMLAVVEGRTRHPACDVNTGQILAAAGIKPHHDPRYLNAVTKATRENPPADAITLHKCDPEQMRIVHQALYYPSWRIAP